MVFDMHCHTSEGSPDSFVSVDKTIKKLKDKGYNGMLVTDHNSYKGYKSVTSKLDDFVVLRGIEYDTRDAGHMLIILPSHIKYDIFEYRGMSVEDVIKIVHVLGGIIGPAHTYDYFRLGICNTKYKDNLELLSQFDFIETFNACLSEKSHKRSDELAKKLNKPCFAGSDSHESVKVGLARTEFPIDIKSEDDLIACVKAANYTTIKAYGEHYDFRYAKLHSMGVFTGGFACGVLNRCISLNGKKNASLILHALGVN